MIFKTLTFRNWNYFVAIVNSFKYKLRPLVNTDDQPHCNKSDPLYLVYHKSGS